MLLFYLFIELNLFRLIIVNLVTEADEYRCPARARLIDSRRPAPAEGSALRFISSLCVSLLKPFPSLEEKLSRNSSPDLLARDLPSLAATTGRAAAQPFAGDERILQVCHALAPSLSLCCARRGAPNPNKNICIRI